MDRTKLFRQSYPQYRPEIYAKALLEDDVDLDPPNLLYKTRAARKRPWGPNLNLLEQAAPTSILARDQNKTGKCNDEMGSKVGSGDQQETKGRYHVAFREETEKSQESTKEIDFRASDNRREKENGKERKGTIVEKGDEKEAAGETIAPGQELIDNYKQSLYHSTYKSDY